MARVTVELLPEKRVEEVELKAGTVRELLHRLGMSVEDAVVVKDGRPLLEDEVLGDGDKVLVLRAASGG